MRSILMVLALIGLVLALGALVLQTKERWRTAMDLIAATFVLQGIAHLMGGLLPHPGAGPEWSGAISSFALASFLVVFRRDAWAHYNPDAVTRPPFTRREKWQATVWLVIIIAGMIGQWL